MMGEQLGILGAFSVSMFKAPGKAELSETNPKVTVPDTFYRYQIGKYINSSIEFGSILLSDFIAKGENSQEPVTQWLASKAERCAEGRVGFSVGKLLNSYVDFQTIVFSLTGKRQAEPYYIRPVVTLSSNVELTGNPVEGWKIVEKK